MAPNQRTSDGGSDGVNGDVGASDIEVGEPSYSNVNGGGPAAATRNAATSSSSSSSSPHNMLKSQLVLLERQLMETRRLLHRQEQEQQQQQQQQPPRENPTEIPTNEHDFHATTPLQFNGKRYYGTLNDTTTAAADSDRVVNDHEPFLPHNHSSNNSNNNGNDSNIPSEIRMTRNVSEGANTLVTTGEETHRSGATASTLLHHIFDDAVSIVRSEDGFTKEEVNHESENYLYSSILERAFPERQFALFVTLLFELPVLFMISGGSDQLCALVGRSKYQLLMAFLPLTSAISGNVGLQASTLTTRAISHNHVTTSSYMPWFLTEVGAAFCLAMGMGTLLGSLALYASGWDIAFALTIFVAQVISIVTAGCTGTFAPLLFSFIFRRDSGKWGGPLETAVQDIVGSFAMVVISYKILQLLGPHDIDPSDQCGGGAV